MRTSPSVVHAKPLRWSVLLFIVAVAVLAILTPMVMAGDSADYAAKEARLPSLGWVSPFVAMLLCIALLPLLPHAHHWWESNWAN